MYNNEICVLSILLLATASKSYCLFKIKNIKKITWKKAVMAFPEAIKPKYLIPSTLFILLLMFNSNDPIPL